jgi:transposase
MLRTGAPWHALPARYGPWRTGASRFSRWRHAGVFQRLSDTLKHHADATGQLDRDVHFLDSSVVRAHQHAAGAKRGLPRPKRSGAVGEASARRSTSVPAVPGSS